MIGDVIGILVQCLCQLMIVIWIDGRTHGRAFISTSQRAHAVHINRGRILTLCPCWAVELVEKRLAFSGDHETGSCRRRFPLRSIIYQAPSWLAGGSSSVNMHSYQSPERVAMICGGSNLSTAQDRVSMQRWPVSAWVWPS